MLKNRLFALAFASVIVSTNRPSGAADLVENFSGSPNRNGWKIFGNGALFIWNATNQNLEVTWDSSQPNSYFYHSLGTILTKTDDFSFSFDLQLTNATAGINPQKPSPFQLSVGLLNLDRASQTNFVRGTGSDSPDLVEFSFFPDPGGAWIYGPSLTSVLVDWTGTNWSTHGFGAQGLAPQDLYHVDLSYTASNQTLRTTITQNGTDFGQVSDAQLTTNFQDFNVNCFAICSYSDAGQDPAFAGSILAHGTIDNITVTTPPPPVGIVAGGFMNGFWQVLFNSSSNWLYVLERTEEFESWTAVSAAVAGTGGALRLQDTNSVVAHALYRVRAQRP
jgi:hypothetical protein